MFFPKLFGLQKYKIFRKLPNSFQAKIQISLHAYINFAYSINTQ